MILVTGATGFLGGHLVPRLVGAGHKVRCLVRPRSDTSRFAGAPVEFAHGDIADQQSVERAAAGAQTLIHLVGIIRERGEVTFERLHTEATRNVVQASRVQSVKRFIYVSAVGAAEDAASRYHQTKWHAEQEVRKSGLQYLILRPSIICGQGDGFVSLLVQMLSKQPVFPILGSGEYRLQPVWVSDLHACILKALADADVWNRTYEIGGPQALTFNEMVEQIMEVSGIRRRTVHMPLWLMRPLVAALQHLPGFPLTSEQLLMMQQENVCDIAPMRRDFGIEPLPFRQVIETYLPGVISP